MLLMSAMRQRSSRKQGNDNLQDALLTNADSDNNDRRFFVARTTRTRWVLTLGIVIVTVVLAWLVVDTSSAMTTTVAGAWRNKHHAVPDNGRGGVALVINNNNGDNDIHDGYWIIKACPSRQHGKACPDTTDFPLHVQIWNNTTTPSSTYYMMPPAIWEPVDAHNVCGGGKAWRLPIPSAPGTYTVDLQWYKTACVHGHLIEPWQESHQVTVEADKTTTTTTTASLSFPHEPWKVHHQNLFVKEAAWHATESAPPLYEWKTAALDKPSAKQLTTQNNAAAVWQESVVVKPEPGYGKFGELSNYELLCFVGNKTMQDVRASFLDLRGQLFKGQRPFKFHFYNVADLEKPDRYWTEEKKTGMRKCKHMLINMEEFVQPLSQREYQAQIQNFVGHLLKLMNDETFPIRLLTWTESAVGTPYCHSPFLPWSNQHPCNAVLHSLFQQDPPVFPPRVKLLDNTDLTLPVDVDGSGGGNEKTSMRPYFLAAIALRIFVIVGEQVAAWRQVGQIGKIDGLYRNGEVEPNFKLEPYLRWGEPL